MHARGRTRSGTRGSGSNPVGRVGESPAKAGVRSGCVNASSSGGELGWQPAGAWSKLFRLSPLLLVAGRMRASWQLAGSCCHAGDAPRLSVCSICCGGSVDRRGGDGIPRGNTRTLFLQPVRAHLRPRQKRWGLSHFPVPGEAQVTLPVGRVKLRYQESYRAWSGGEPGVGIDFDVPAKLRVGVTSPGGESLDIKGPGFRGMGASVEVGGNWSRPWPGHRRDRPARRVHDHRRSRTQGRGRAADPGWRVARPGGARVAKAQTIPRAFPTARGL